LDAFSGKCSASTSTRSRKIRGRRRGRGGQRGPAEEEECADDDLVSEIAAFEKSDASDRPANRGVTELADAGSVEVIEEPVDEGDAVAEDGDDAEDVEPAYAPAGHRYELPDLDLLEEPVHEDHRVLEDELRENSRLLLAKLGDFGVQGAITCIRPGPVITRYELEPAPGIKITKIIGLADDLALASEGDCSPRVAPIPKSAALGIELPNHHRETVHFKSIVSSDGYKQNPSLLRLALGVDIAGHPYVADLARMPHLLIAGATGSGKSVCINTLLLSLLMNATPQQLQLLLIDPKMLELSIYNDVPHLLEDVVTEPRRRRPRLAGPCARWRSVTRSFLVAVCAASVNTTSWWSASLGPSRLRAIQIRQSNMPFRTSSSSSMSWPTS
jgi:S-DNA-T family DNA segregation ATPase FtsK/SpoIIIE